MISPSKAGRFSLLLIAACALQCGCAPEIDVHAKANEVRAALNKTETQDEFIRVAESHGLDCKDSSVGHAVCWWTEPDRGLFDSDMWTWGSIHAFGEFTDGRKSGDYDVKDVYTGP